MAKPDRGASSPRITILGFGNWGTSLANALRGAAIPLDEIVVSSEASRSRARARAGGFAINTTDRAQFGAEILWLCVPDSAIAKVTRRLVERREQLSTNKRLALRGQIVVHSSGALSTAILGEAAAAGASVAAVHPWMTFPTRTPVPLAGAPFGIEAEASVRRKLSAIVRRLGGEPFALDSSGKALYHATAMLASPLLASLLAAALETAAFAGLAPRRARRLIGPIAQATLQNVFTHGVSRSFSGPIARGDAGAIHLHLQALSPHPIIADVYRSLALYALDALPVRNCEKTRRLFQQSSSKRRPDPASVDSNRMRD